MSVMWNLSILFIIIIIIGIGFTLTDLVTDFRPMVIEGIARLLISIAHYLIPGYEIRLVSKFDIRMLTFALAFVAMYIIPGHILNYRAKKACLKN
jgi:hypothetical protein